MTIFTNSQRARAVCIRRSIQALVRMWLCLSIAVGASAVWAQPLKGSVPDSFAQEPLLPGRYIVVFKPGVGNAELETNVMMNGTGGQIHHRYRHALRGFSASIPEPALQRILNNPNVAFVEQDRIVQLSQSVANSELAASWGLDRIDQRLRSPDGSYGYNYDGAGVLAFVIDTGIFAGHSEFTGRVLEGYTAILDGNGTNDCAGHGTHVAATLGGSRYGVAKKVSLVPVRVLGCSGSGSLSGVVSGLDWVAGYRASSNSNAPAVANMSLGSSKSSTVNAAVAGAVDKGVTVVVAAGNSNADACRYSPASEPKAITVGATTSADARASYSNFGKCVDLFAPGSGITSAWISSTRTDETNTISGTSMASPHVAGVAALALSANAQATPAMVARFILDNATSGALSSIGNGSVNKLVYSLASGAPTVTLVRSVKVQALSSTARLGKRSWQAVVRAVVVDADSLSPVPNATVSGVFSVGGAASCLTGFDGVCTLTSGQINYGSLTQFTVSDVTGTDLQLDRGLSLMSLSNISSQ